MKKLLIILITLASSYSYSQDKWRTLTFETSSGYSFSSQAMTTVSANLDYELSNGYSLISWTGINYNYTTKNNWMSNSTTINKKVGSFQVGAGVIYMGTYQFNNNNQVFGVVTVRKRFKL